MLGGQTNHGWQLLFPLQVHAGGSDSRLYDGSDLKAYLLMRWSGPAVSAVVRPAEVYLFDFFFCSSIRFYLLVSPYLCLIY